MHIAAVLPYIRAGLLMVLLQLHIKQEIPLLLFMISERNKNSLWGFSQKMKRSLSFKSYPNFCTTLRASGAQNGYVQIKLRFYSGKHIFECARIVPADQTVRLKTSLEKWKYRSKVTKIQVMAAPVMVVSGMPTLSLL